MWAVLATLLYKIADYFLEKHEQKKANNATNNVDAMSDDDVSRVLRERWTKH